MKETGKTAPVKLSLEDLDQVSGGRIMNRSKENIARMEI